MCNTLGGSGCGRSRKIARQREYQLAKMKGRCNCSAKPVIFCSNAIAFCCIAVAGVWSALTEALSVLDAVFYQSVVIISVSVECLPMISTDGDLDMRGRFRSLSDSEDRTEITLGSLGSFLCCRFFSNSFPSIN